MFCRGQPTKIKEETPRLLDLIFQTKCYSSLKKNKNKNKKRGGNFTTPLEVRPFLQIPP
jgi:hypothetical protein